MTNSFYNPSGNPATGSEGLSSLMRNEFLSISAAFDIFPTIAGNGGKVVMVNPGGTALTVSVGTLALAGNLTTTGAFNTTFAQGATTTLTLPVINGTLATMANVATETARATAAEGANATAITTETNRATAAEALKAPIASPVFTGPVTTNSGFFLNRFNTALVSPPAAVGLAESWNFSNGSQEADFWNTEAAPAVSFRFLQRTGVSTATSLFDIGPTGNAHVYGTLTVDGVATAPTAAPGTNTTQLATTAFSVAAVLVETNRATAAEGTNATAISTETTRATTAEALLAPKASPALTGTPTVPTAAPGTNTTQAASTAFVTAGISNTNSIVVATWTNVTGSRSLGVTFTNSRTYPIVVLVQIGVTTSPVITINGVALSQALAPPASWEGVYTFQVPPGQTYRIDNGALRIWSELF